MEAREQRLALFFSEDAVVEEFWVQADECDENPKLARMTNRELGAFFLLRLQAYFSGPSGILPLDDAMLAKGARMTVEEWLEVKPAVIDACLVENGLVDFSTGVRVINPN